MQQRRIGLGLASLTLASEPTQVIVKEGGHLQVQSGAVLNVGGGASDESAPSDLPPMPPSPPPGAVRRVLGAADKDELMALIHIGETTADRILAARPIRSRSDLLAISGIGEARLASILNDFSIAITINDATEEELAQADGIGPVTAASIVAARPITKKSDLTDISGIGEARSTSLLLTFPIVGINEATADELMRVDSIGEVLAARIIAARPITSKTDLTAISHIGDGRATDLLAAFPIIA